MGVEKVGVGKREDRQGTELSRDVVKNGGEETLFVNTSWMTGQTGEQKRNPVVVVCLEMG